MAKCHVCRQSVTRRPLAVRVDAAVRRGRYSHHAAAQALGDEACSHGELFPHRHPHSRDAFSARRRAASTTTAAAVTGLARNASQPASIAFRTSTLEVNTRAHREHTDLRSAIMLAHPASDAEAVHARQHQVEHDEDRLDALHLLDAGLPIAGAEYAESRRLKLERQQVAPSLVRPRSPAPGAQRAEARRTSETTSASALRTATRVPHHEDRAHERTILTMPP